VVVGGATQRLRGVFCTQLRVEARAQQVLLRHSGAPWSISTLVTAPPTVSAASASQIVE
jgi:hypothetical protein